MATVSPHHFVATSGETAPVWAHTEPYSNRPKFPQLSQNTSADVCIIGSGISGVQSAYELIKRGRSVVMLEARDAISGETDRTSGHLASALDDHYLEIEKKHGEEGAKLAADSHKWASKHVGEVARELGIDCEYRQLPAYLISQYDRQTQSSEHDAEVKRLIMGEVEQANRFGLSAEFKTGFAVKGWDGKPDQRDASIFHEQATFHPTKYLTGVLKWLKEQPSFTCYTHSRVMDVQEKGIEVMGIGKKTVTVSTDTGHTVECSDAIMATCVPLQKLSIVAELEYMRTYCIAVKVPQGYVEDYLLYDTAEAYKYVRLTRCDEQNDYLVVGGCDHKVGQEETLGRFQELEDWIRERFTKAGSVDYAWSGQVFEPVDYMGFIGLNPGTKHTYIITGDSGNGLTHGVIAGRLITDQIEGVKNYWGKLYSPSRKASLLKSAGTAMAHDVQIQAQYKRFLQSDIKDIEDLAPGSGGVLNSTTKVPVAVYKDDEGGVHKFSALCPHMKGVICWNGVEKSWDCPVHGSRFSKDGVCVMGPAKGHLNPADESGEKLQSEAVK
ncbi:uncharacterized protein LTR77_001592 [Saxophila tyrrhenica]|uniref:Rieske domain-containing protein n=1 Tax=Saxophila tyrrhenica TaxID=1690608 RepID=A0AAV9PMI9_9PEZI|nr:hypothetical protein LTR77_001592 [Saxophila tyrrhenica]